MNYPFSSKNLVAGTKIWSLRLVPRIQTMFEFVGQVPGTCPLKLCWSPCVNYPFSSKKLVVGTKIWSLRHVPRIQTMFEFVGQVPGTCPLKLCWSPRVNCSWDKSLRPNENKRIADQYFRSHNRLRTPFQDRGRR